MNKLIKIAIAAAATLTLGLSALAQADEVAAPDAAKHDCKGGKGGMNKDGKRFGRHGLRGKLMNSVTAADLKQVGLTDAQIQQFEAAKPFERGELRKLNLMNRDQFHALRKIVKARMPAPAPETAPVQ